MQAPQNSVFETGLFEPIDGVGQGLDDSDPLSAISSSGVNHSLWVVRQTYDRSSSELLPATPEGLPYWQNVSSRLEFHLGSWWTG